MQNLRQQIAFYLEDNQTPIGITLSLILLGLILLSSGIFVAETYVINPQLQSFLDRLDTFVLIIFTLEYIIRLWCAPKRLSYIFSLFSLIDLLSILPLILGFIDIRFLRIFRCFRILRIVRFFEFKVSVFQIKREDEVIFARILLTLFCIIFVFAGLIYQVEHPGNPKDFGGFLDAVYFCVVTMTTVGFGDVTPISDGGRLLTVLMILTGVTLIPWEVGELIKQVVKTTNQMNKQCTGCGLSTHDKDAIYCKRCATKL